MIYYNILECGISVMASILKESENILYDPETF